MTSSPYGSRSDSTPGLGGFLGGGVGGTCVKSVVTSPLLPTNNVKY